MFSNVTVSGQSRNFGVEKSYGMQNQDRPEIFWQQTMGQREILPRVTFKFVFLFRTEPAEGRGITTRFIESSSVRNTRPPLVSRRTSGTQVHSCEEKRDFFKQPPRHRSIEAGRCACWKATVSDGETRRRNKNAFNKWTQLPSARFSTRKLPEASAGKDSTFSEPDPEIGNVLRAEEPQ